MVNILQFPGFGKSGKTEGASQDVDLEALFADDAAMVFSADQAMPVLRFPAPISTGASGNWTNQELADLYRVEALLVQAGVRIDTARGVTDENDPWFVFCRPDGEVFVHMARIDGHYLLDSPGMGTPVYGDDFASLIDIFVRQQVEKTPSGNVVRFRPGAGRDGTVRLHPAMMLAALIWTLYIASDTFTGTAEAAESNDSGHDGNHGADAAWHHIRSVAGSSSETGSQAPGSSPLNSRDEISAKATTYIDGRGSHQAGSIAASLSAIAVSWGLYDPHNSIVSEPAVVTTSGTVQQPAMQPSGQQDTTTAIAYDAADGDATHHAHEEKYTAVPPVEQKAVQQQHAAANVEEKHGAPVVAMDTAHAVQAGPAPVLTMAKYTQVVDSASQADTITIGNKPSDTSDMQSILKLAALYLGDSATYTVGGISVAATFDVSRLDGTAAEIVFSSITTPETPAVQDTTAVTAGGSATPASTTSAGVARSSYVPSYLTAYDQTAKDFVYKFLVQAASSLEMIKIDNAIIFVDTTAIDEPADVAYVRSWVLDGDTTISMIGHTADFAKYDLA
ncbi:MAG: hypothetical protein KBG72_00110 [Agrobacterium sp.]|nr:hypothetical protein [Agrobacterium sp.]